jgi:predicted ribosomally synthesized peptide with nif11-like leader
MHPITNAHPITNETILSMTSTNLENFQQKFSQSPEFQQQIREAQSVPQLLTLLQQWDCPLAPEELITLAQQAYQTWLESLKPTIQLFFVEAHENKALNREIETCKNPEAVIALAKAHGFEISEADLQMAAEAASQIEGFSFEKLWFKGLGL